MPIARPEPQTARVIAHVDMDCFYVQVEQRRNPKLRGRPTAVVQYNSWRGGGLIAVSYEARNFGVKRSMRGDEAKSVCPDIELVQVPVARGKADLNLYRSAGSEVVSILATKGRCERASIDEVYLDLTDAAEAMLSEAPPEALETIDEGALKSHVLGLHHGDTGIEGKVKEWLCRIDADHRDKLLACGAIIVAELRNRVLKETQFTCSAGIAHNKMLAKLASAMHKPAQQTVVPSSAVEDLLSSFPVKKMKQLGGKLGSSLQDDLGVNTVGDLLKFSKEKLQDLYGFNTGIWLWNIARGISGDEVVGRLLPKSHGCGKTFPGRQKTLKTLVSVENWINQLCEELSERIESDLDQNKRVAHTLVLHATAYKANDMDPRRKFPSKSCQLRYGIAKIQEDAMKLFDSGLREFLGSQNNGWGITGLSVSASKILEKPQGTCSILKFLQAKVPSPSSDCLNSIILESGTLPSEATQEVKQTEVGYEAISVASDSNYENKPCHTSRMPSRKRKEVVSSSILKFFQEKNPSSLAKKSKSDESSLGLASFTSNSETEEFSEVNKREQGNFLESDTVYSDSHYETRNEYDSWVPCADDIDSSVLAELPEEIQRELRSWMHPNKHTSTSRKGSTIPRESSLGQASFTSSSKTEEFSELNKREQGSFLETGNECSENHYETQNGHDSGVPCANDIDPSVLAELPEEIQRELRSWMHPNKHTSTTKHPSTSKKGSTISHYFSPAKKS